MLCSRSASAALVEGGDGAPVAAVELVAGYGRPADFPRDDEQIQFVHAFFDMLVASLRWKNASG